MARTDSVQAAVDAFRGAYVDIEPPAEVKLSDAEMAFWPAVIAARAREEWTAIDLYLAANLCRCMADLEENSRALEAEGAVLENARGTMVGNPRIQIVERLTYRDGYLRKLLRITGASLMPDVDEVARKRKNDLVARQARDDMDQHPDDDLLARPFQ